MIEGAEISLHRDIIDILMTFQSWEKSIYYLANYNIHLGLKTIISCCLQHLKGVEKVWYFQREIHACAFCFCLGISCLFTLDTSQKWIDREASLSIHFCDVSKVNRQEMPKQKQNAHAWISLWKYQTFSTPLRCCKQQEIMVLRPKWIL